MISINCTIEGKTPLLMNPFTDEAQMKATSGTSASIVGDKGTPREQAEVKVYRSAHGGHPIIPQPNLFSCFMAAGKFFKAGKSKITTQKSSLLPACLEIDGIGIPVEHRDPWEVDTRAVRNPSTGGRFQCHRPSFNDWKLSFSMSLDESVMSETFLRDIIDKAGSAIGLGDFRPDCKGPFGKFRVVLWETETE